MPAYTLRELPLIKTFQLFEHFYNLDNECRLRMILFWFQMSWQNIDAFSACDQIESYSFANEKLIETVDATWVAQKQSNTVSLNN